MYKFLHKINVYKKKKKIFFFRYICCCATSHAWCSCQFKLNWISLCTLTIGLLARKPITGYCFPSCCTATHDACKANIRDQNQWNYKSLYSVFRLYFRWHCPKIHCILAGTTTACSQTVLSYVSVRANKAR